MNIKVCSLSTMIANAISAIAQDRSVSLACSLFD